MQMLSLRPKWYGHLFCPPEKFMDTSPEARHADPLNMPSLGVVQNHEDLSGPRGLPFLGMGCSSKHPAGTNNLSKFKKFKKFRRWMWKS